MYILLFTKIIKRRYAKCPSQIDKKTSCCKIFIITVLWGVLSPLSHYFDSAGYANRDSMKDDFTCLTGIILS